MNFKTDTVYLLIDFNISFAIIYEHGRKSRDERRSEKSRPESLIFKPSKVSWVVNSYLARQVNRKLNWFVYSVLGICGLFILWGAISEKALVVDAIGEIIPRSPPIPVTTTSGMVIHSIKVKNNQTVKKGEVLVASTRDLDDEDKKKISETVDQMKHDLELGRQETCDSQCYARIRSFADRGLPLLSRLEASSELSRNLSELGKLYKDYANQVELAKELPATTASLRYEIKNTEQQLKEIKRLGAKKLLAVEFDQLQSKLVNLQAQLKEKSISSAAQLKASRNMVEVMLQGVPASLKSYSADSAIRSPADGIISFAELKGEGQVISPGQLLFYIHTEGTGLAAKLKLPDADIAKIKKGMVVKLDISSYPASEYGVQEATVTEIPEKLSSDGRAVPDNLFEVLADLAHQGVEYGGKTYPLRSGIGLKAKIIIRHERLINFYVKKLLSIKDEYIGNE